jgi:predicted nucleic acid-binding protein
VTPPKRAVDTSLAVPLLADGHRLHAWVNALLDGADLALTAHSLAEAYSVLTRLPGDARLSAADAVALIDDRFPEVLRLPEGTVAGVHRRLAAANVVGGAAYDGLVALAAKENGAVLATRDARAAATYRALGADFELLDEPPAPVL